MPNVLIADDLSPRAVEIFQQRGINADVKTGLKADELAEIIGNYDGLAVRSATKATAAILAKATRLKVIGRAGIGVDNVDIPAATAKGVIVMNTPFGNSITTAEHAIALLLALARDIPQANASTHAGKWEKSKFMGIELTGKTLGVIGCGNIGAIVASRALGLQMKVVAFDPFLSSERAADLGVEKVELATLLPRADFITIHTPMTEQTRNILNATAFAQCRKGVRIINCARGGLVNEADLLAALNSGQVGGAALDVFEVEPAKENALFNHEKVICTPHLGASTSEAQENVALQIAEQMSDYLLNGTVVNALNMPAISTEEATSLKPYLALADKLAQVGVQLCGQQAIQAVQLKLAGTAAALNAKPLTAVMLAALLRGQFGDAVNMVNAPSLAAEAKLAVEVTTQAVAQDYQGVIELALTTSAGQHRVAGTLMGGIQPRLVGLDGMKLEAEFVPLMLLTRNQDKPGFIGKIGSVLGDAGVNIGTFTLGRSGPGGEALALTGVDSMPPAQVLEALRNLPDILQVLVLKIST